MPYLHHIIHHAYIHHMSIVKELQDCLTLRPEGIDSTACAIVIIDNISVCRSLPIAQHMVIVTTNLCSWEGMAHQSVRKTNMCMSCPHACMLQHNRHGMFCKAPSLSFVKLASKTGSNPLTQRQHQCSSNLSLSSPESSMPESSIPYSSIPESSIAHSSRLQRHKQVG